MTNKLRDNIKCILEKNVTLLLNHGGLCWISEHLTSVINCCWL